MFFLTAMMVMLHKIPMIWQMTVHKILEMPFSVEWFGVGLLFSIIDAFLRMYLIYNDIIKTTSL